MLSPRAREELKGMFADRSHGHGWDFLWAILVSILLSVIAVCALINYGGLQTIVAIEERLDNCPCAEVRDADSD